MAASNFAPGGGRIMVIRGIGEIVKLPLPTTARRILLGAPLWTNGASGVEPSSMLAACATSVDHANADFVTAGFVGLAAEERVMQQLATAPAKAYAPGPATLNPNYASDASTPYISAYMEGIARGPVAALAAAHEVGEWVQLAGFVNEGASGFYDPSGTLVADTNYYLYENLLQIATTQAATNAIGRLVERAVVGQTWLDFHFRATVLVAN